MIFTSYWLLLSHYFCDVSPSFELLLMLFYFQMEYKISNVEGVHERITLRRISLPENEFDRFVARDSVPHCKGLRGGQAVGRTGNFDEERLMCNLTASHNR